ncbi:LytR/AlgR family response regulator transcription factor [Salinibacter ruber]|jgi:two-component system LytT family response regulator|nr:LytTR family DNA-binding domain-containing protein [Salinibacter ruber]MCS4054368.1 DNA-binding LytR/AlgR family response regulator [Salinibacter ruber]
MPTPIRCLIADDDPSSQDLLSKYADRHADLDTVGVCEDGIEAANILREKEVDLILLDVEMPEMSGLELVESLSDPPAIVMVTGHEEYAVEAFEVDVVDYLVKPVRYGRFLTATERVSERLGTGGSQDEPSEPTAEEDTTESPHLADTSAEHVFLKDGRRLIRVALKDIQWIKAQGDYMLVQAESDRYMINSTMKELDEKLPSSQFIRIHRSHIVRIDQIKDIEDTTLIIDGKMLPIGPSYQDELIERIQTL